MHVHTGKEGSLNGNLTLGRLGGVQLRIHWSWLVIPLDKVPLLAETARAVDALADLSSKPGANRGLVVDDGRLDGLLSITDLARALQARRPSRPVRA